MGRMEHRAKSMESTCVAAADSRNIKGGLTTIEEKPLGAIAVRHQGY